MAMSGTRKTVLIITGILAVLVLVVFIGVAVIVSAFRKGAPTIRDNSVLALRVAGSLPDYAPEDPFRRFFGGPDQSLTGLVMQLKKAKVDTECMAVTLDIDMSGVGWGKAEEIRDAVADFRASGKPVYAYMEFGLNKEYYIATACDKIFVPPPGELFITGLAADVMFFRGTLDKLGIYPDIYQIGKYKSAGDMFTQKKMTDAHREYVNSLLDDLFNRYVTAIAQARHKTPDEVRNLIDDAPYSAAKAKEVGLIDETVYHDELDKQIKAQLGYKDSDQFAPVRATDYREVRPESLGLNKGEKIAVIYATGDIGSGRSENSPSGDQSIGSDTLAKAVTDAAEDKSIKAIVLRVDSPGGSGLASDHHLARGGCCEPKEAGRGFNERRCCFGWLLHLCQRQQDCCPTFDNHRVDWRGGRQAGDERLLRLVGHLQRIRAPRQAGRNVSRDREVFRQRAGQV